MEESSNKSVDIFGIKPIGEALNTAVTKSFEGVEAFLSRVCVPAMDELGLMAKDSVRFWRLNNVISMLKKAEGKMEFVDDQLSLNANPRVALAIIENASIAENDEVQELWAGLFAATCSSDRSDDGNLIFVNLLNQLTVTQAKILKRSCEVAPKHLHDNGLVSGGTTRISCAELMALTGVNDIHRLDIELDHLREIGLSALTPSGFDTSGEELNASLTPSALALGLYIRTQGSRKTVAQYWQDVLLLPEEWRAQGGFLGL